jgi:hypothetical protein
MQRLWKLKGYLSDMPATGSVTVNGTEVYNGTFSQGSSDEPDGFLCEFAIEVPDLPPGKRPEFQVVMTVATGTAHVGMFKYNYASVVNPALTQEELAYFTAGTAAGAPAEIQADVVNKGGWLIPDETAFDYGNDPDQCYDNRKMATINGIPISDEIDRTYLYTSAGSVLAFTTIMFS